MRSKCKWKQYTLQQKFSEASVGLYEEMGFQPSSKLSTTNRWWAELWWKHVQDSWGCNIETPSAELCSCQRDKHVVAFCRTKICPTRNAGDWDADVVEVGRTVLTDTVKCRDCYFELYSVLHWEPMKHVVQGRRDVFVSANTDDQTGGSVQDRLKSTDDLWRDTVQNIQNNLVSHNLNFNININKLKCDFNVIQYI